MKVKLLHYTPLEIAVNAIRTCWDSFDKSDSNNNVFCGVCKADLTDIDDIINYPDGMWECPTCNKGMYPEYEKTIGEKDKALIDRVANKNRHSSTIEHLYYNFKIDGISRACLQELARHRMASLSVKSTRYTLKELKEEEPFVPIEHKEGKGMFCGVPDLKRASKYLIMTNNDLVNNASALALEGVRGALNRGISNDIVKYCLPEAYKTELTWSINARSLQNFLSLRSDKSALWEIRDLANAVYNSLPQDHKYLFESYMKQD